MGGRIVHIPGGESHIKVKAKTREWREYPRSSVGEVRWGQIVAPMPKRWGSVWPGGGRLRFWTRRGHLAHADVERSLLQTRVELGVKLLQ